MILSRRRSLIVCVAALCVLALSIVPPRADRSVIAVSRLGSTVRLLPAGFAVSVWPLSARLEVPAGEGCAMVPGRFAVTDPDGSPLEVVARLRLSGHGRLPFDAAEVRRDGLERAVGEWLGGALETHLDPVELSSSSELWREIFGDEGASPRTDLTSVLSPLVEGVRLDELELRLQPDPDTVRRLARRELTGRTRSEGRLIVLGLDALDWQLADDLMRRGLMPNLRYLVANGAHATLEVPPPLISPVVWTTIATGVPPEVHGVLDFLEPDPDGGPPHPVGSGSCGAATLWRMVAAAGRSVSVIGWWATFPAVAPENGTVYSDRLTEQLLGLEADSPGVADPPQAAAAARDLVLRGSEVTASMLSPFALVEERELEALRGRDGAWDDPVGGLAKLVAATISVERLTQRELDRGTEVVLSYLEGTDTVGHLFAPYRPPPLPGTDPQVAQRFAAVVDRYYAHVDGWIGGILELLGERDTLVLVSDHGFEWFEGRPRVAAGAHTATAVWWHRPQGAFLAFGPGIRHTPSRERLGLMDVTPTLLALAGLPPAAEMPGTVPDWLWRSDEKAASIAERRVNYAALLPVTAGARVELSPEAREEELAKLRALGYVAPEGETVTAPAQPPPPAFDRAEARRLTNLGTSRGSTGDRDGAQEAFLEAIAADPFYPEAHYNLGLSYRKQGRMEESDREIWRAIELGVGDREMAVVRMALDYRQRGDFDRAREVFARGRALFPDSAMIWLNSGVFLGERGLIEESKLILERAVRLAPENPNALVNLAAAHLALGETLEARRVLTRAVELAPDNDAIRGELARLGGPLGTEPR